MRIFIDIGHPAHIHYFRNFIKLMKANGHEFFVSARNRSIIHSLLDYYNIPFYNRGKGGNGILGKLFYMFQADFKLLRQAYYFKSDLYLSFASPYAAQIAWILGKPHIVLDDTEHARFGQSLYKPFSSVFLNPFCFYKNFGNRQIFFNSFSELFYLHPTYYKPNSKVIELLDLKKNEKFILLRFVSWKASHDIGQHGLDLSTVKQIIPLLLKNEYRVFISTEDESIESFLRPYLLNIPPENIHDVLYFADLFISESGTMASEATILGTPVIYVNSLPLMGYLHTEQQQKLLFHYPTSAGVLEKIKELLTMNDRKETYRMLSRKLVSDKIDPTSFLIWFIENYPGSFHIMREKPGYQERFK